MSRVERWFMGSAVFLAGGSGLVYGYMRYFSEPADAFAIAGHPWQPHAQHLHILVVPLLVLAVGHLLVHHALAYRRGGVREGRRTGNGMLLSAMPMIFSGSLIQVAVSTSWRTAWIAVHVVSSLLWLLLYIGHWWSHFRARPA